MPKYSVRFYSEYCDEYLVEAETADAARDLAEEAECHADITSADEFQARFQGTVEIVQRHAYVDSNDTCITRVDEDGNWIEED